MPSNDFKDGATGNDLAFNRVLEAEAMARERIDACRLEAARLIQAAETRARDIETRAEARLLKVHRLADASVERALASLRAAEVGGARGDPSDDALARLEQAVAALVDEILGLAGAGAEPDGEGDGR